MLRRCEQNYFQSLPGCRRQKKPLHPRRERRRRVLVSKQSLSIKEGEEREERREKSFVVKSVITQSAELIKRLRAKRDNNAFTQNRSERLNRGTILWS